MYAHHQKVRQIEIRKIGKTITVPNMVQKLGNSIKAAMKNPVDQYLDMYSSTNPELLNPLDLKMMSRLDRLRKHNELREITKHQKSKLDKSLEKGEKQKAANKVAAEKAKKQAEQQATANVNQINK